MSQSRFYSISPKGKMESFNSAEELISNHKNESYLWFDYYNPSSKELSTLIEPLSLHPLTIEDCTDENFVPKIEEYPNNSFMIFNAYTYEQKELYIDEVDFIIGKNYLVTVSGYNSNGRKPLNGIEKVVEREIENAKHGASHLLHIILDYIVDKKFVSIEKLEDELDEAEDILLSELEKFQAQDIILTRRHLLALRKSLFHEREILVKICRKDCPFISEKAIFHFRDIYDHLSKFFELTESYREIVSSLLEMNVSMMNNILTKSANQTNLSVRRLTLISTIFMPLTLLAGIGGMSEWSMMSGPENWKVSYPLFIFGMIIIGSLNYLLIKYLEKRD
ncbi:MAG TPA: Mg2+/Co2+ transporter [Bacteroidales bacterium]|nr:Mg2+/Co2+ transporter [Bacteroidales bacterium]